MADNEAEVREDGIYYSLGGPYWILMTKSWGLNDSQTFVRTDRLHGLRMVIEKTLDWHIPNLQWNPIPFEKDKLLAQLDAYTARQIASSTDTNQIVLDSLAELAKTQPTLSQVCGQVQSLLDQSAELVKQARRLHGDAEEMFVIPTALQPRLATAYLRCYVASFNVPFEQLVPSSSVEATTATPNNSGS